MKERNIMSYAELTRKYMLKEITKEEYEQGKENIIYSLFNLYEESITNEDMFREKIKQMMSNK